MVTVGIHTVARAIVAQHHHLTQRRRCGVFEAQVAVDTATVIQSKCDFAGRYRISTTAYLVSTPAQVIGPSRAEDESHRMGSLGLGTEFSYLGTMGHVKLHT